MVQIEMKWAGGLKFQGTSAFGHHIITDAAVAAGGEEAGFKPTELLLYGIAGCTGIDVVRILKKQRQQLTSLKIQVSGRQREDYPKPFHTIEVKYIASGKDLDRQKLAQAIELSERKYCVVSQTVQHESRIVSSFQIVSE